MKKLIVFVLHIIVLIWERKAPITADYVQRCSLVINNAPLSELVYVPHKLTLRKSYFVIQYHTTNQILASMLVLILR